MDIDKIKRELKIVLIVALIIIFVKVMNIDFFNTSDDGITVQKAYDSSAKDSLNDESDEDDGYIYTHITGEIKKPGVYKMKAGTRMDDLVKEAGGLTDEADIDQINLSEKLVDEERIIVPSKSGSSEEGITSAAIDAKTKKININKASLSELMTLPGVGEKTAQKFIDYREQKKFKKIEDVMNIEGIGENKFKNIKEYISVNGR